MVEKTLSNGTLNLRFMQNARTAQHLPRTEPDRAPVKDEAEWVIPHEIRRAWAPTAYRSEKAVVYETSYLPFLFPSVHDTPAVDGSSSLSPQNTLHPRGRRAFNKRGQEITHQSAPPATDPERQESTEREMPEPPIKTRPHSISSTGIAIASARQSKNSNKEPSKNAQNLIFDMAGVGTDLRQSSSTQGAAFLRPAGVDGPALLAKPSIPTKTAFDSSTGATNPPRSHLKRSRPSGEADKAKKKTKTERIE